MNGVLVSKDARVGKTALHTANSFVFSRERYAARIQCTDTSRGKFPETAFGTLSSVRIIWVGTTSKVSPAHFRSQTNSKATLRSITLSFRVAKIPVPLPGIVRGSIPLSSTPPSIAQWTNSPCISPIVECLLQLSLFKIPVQNIEEDCPESLDLESYGPVLETYLIIEFCVGQCSVIYMPTLIRTTVSVHPMHGFSQCTRNTKNALLEMRR